MANLVFTREQIKPILEEFASFLMQNECTQRLRTLAPDENKMNDYIEENQKRIFVKHNVDPVRGMQDLRKIPQAFKADQEIVSLLMFAAAKEEMVTNAALSGETGTLEDRQMQQQMIGLDFQSIQKQMQAIQNDPQELQKMQAMMQQQISALPEDVRQQLAKQMMDSMTPEQKEQVAKMQQSMSNPLNQPHAHQETASPTPQAQPPQPSLQPVGQSQIPAHLQNVMAQMQQQLDFAQDQMYQPTYQQPQGSPFEKRT